MGTALAQLTCEELKELTRGTVVMVQFSPIKGHELRDPHPAVVISADRFNKVFSTVVVVPITSLKPPEFKVYSTEVKLASGDGGLPKDSKAMPLQIRTIDRFERVEKILGQIPKDKMSELESKLRLTLGMIQDI